MIVKQDDARQWLAARAGAREPTEEMRVVGGAEIFGADRDHAVEYCKEEKFDSAADLPCEYFRAMWDAAPEVVK